MRKSRRVLVAGGGHGDIPIIQAAKSLGFHVVTTGNRPQDPGHKISNEYCNADYSVPEQILAVARRYDVSAVCSCCNDFSAIACSYIADEMDFPGQDPYQTSLLIHHKDLYRKFAADNSVPTPRAVQASDSEQALERSASLSFPLLIKPVDLSGGKGITLAKDVSELAAAAKTALAISKAKRIVVEEFKTGTRHGFSAFLNEGKVVFHFSDNEDYYNNPYMVAGTYTPGAIPASVLESLCRETERIASLLDLSIGIFHVQFILQGEQATIIEICRRPPGDLYLKFVEWATGVNYAAWHVRASVGLDCSEIKQERPTDFFARYCIMAPQNGVVKNVEFHQSLSGNIVDKVEWWKPGESIQNHLVDKLGIVFLRFDNRQEMLEKTSRFYELCRVQMET